MIMHPTTQPNSESSGNPFMEAPKAPIVPQPLENASELSLEVLEVSKKLNAVLEQFKNRVIGQSHVARRVLQALLCDGHVLLEGLPGLAKTTALKTMSQLCGVSFSRIQFTPDLLPSDVVGTQIYDPRQTAFQTRKGPVFSNLVLADEINRAPAKVQSALLEAMGEKQVTIGGETFVLEDPFMVMATQNPIEQEGTYRLPEAQLDRFLFKVIVQYGTFQDEKAMLQASSTKSWSQVLSQVLTREEILHARAVLKNIRMVESVQEYCVHLVFATRDPSAYKLADLKSKIEIGASPRATLALMQAGKAQALIQGRYFVTPEDIKDVAPDILRHRIVRSYQAESEGISIDAMTKRILDVVPLP